MKKTKCEVKNALSVILIFITRQVKSPISQAEKEGAPNINNYFTTEN